MEYKKGMSVYVSIKALYDAVIEPTCGMIATETDDSGRVAYFDLYNRRGVLACMDGEECTIKEVRGDRIMLVNSCGDSEVSFTLSRDEAAVALFSSGRGQGTEAHAILHKKSG